MLSLDLREKLNYGEYQPFNWLEIKEEYLPNNQEKIILKFETECNEKGMFIGPSIIIIYNGTDKDFIEKYNSYMSSWDTEKNIEDIINEYNIPREKANNYTQTLEKEFFKYGGPEKLTLNLKD